MLSYHNSRVDTDDEDVINDGELDEDYQQIDLLEEALENASESAKSKVTKRWCKSRGTANVPPSLLRFVQ